MTTVVAGLIEREGRILICRRSASGRYPLKWEFPGGKVEPQETPEDALARELEEELALRVMEAREMERYEFRYPGREAILLIFFRVTQFAGEPRNRVFEEIRWEAPKDLPAFDFLEGDLDFVGRLAG